MDVRVNFEIGHEASIRTKRTPDGFTHDWEVFVKGHDGAEIHHFVEKVVFLLHDTFPRPKRVVKEPPYIVKESGYAGFVLPIEIYLQNKYEPKKIKFTYDLNLQPAGPPILKFQKEKYVFSSPNEEFKAKLLKGGGVTVSSSASHESLESRSAPEEKSQLVSKPKLSGSDGMKKHKIRPDDMKVSNFVDLFGTPITKTSKIPEPKAVPKDPIKSTSSSSTSGTKSDKDKEKEKNKNKYSPNKEKDKDRERDKSKDKGDSDRKTKEDKKSKDRNKERERSREKSTKRDKSPRPPSPRRSPKRISSPKRPSTPPPLPKHKDKEEKRDKDSREKEKRPLDEKDKSEKKAKKDKRDRDKDHKENKHKDKEGVKSSEHKEHKNKDVKVNKELVKEKEQSPPPILQPPPPPPPKEKKEKPKEKEMKESKQQVKDEKDVAGEKPEKIKSEKSEEKQKHKHKKKDKERKEKKEDKDKSHKSEKKSEKASINNSKMIESIKEPMKEPEKSSSLFSSPKNEPVDGKPKLTKPLNALFSEMDNESSNSSVSSVEHTFIEPNPPKMEVKSEPVFVEPKKEKVDLDPLPPPPPKPKKDKSKKKDKKTEKDSEKRRKRKSDVVDEAPQEKVVKEDGPAEPMNVNSGPEEQKSSIAQALEANKENPEKPEEYINILKDLQHKIMSLQDNSELQKVVQLIAETGRYEVSSRTFDFDLCLLDRSTVQQLQEFFATSS